MRLALRLTAGLMLVALFSTAFAAKLVLVGDSITQGVGPDGSYQAQLAELLGPTYEIVNAGISGATWTTTNQRDYRTKPAYRRAIEANGDIYTIMLGTNDAKLNLENAQQNVWPGAKETFEADVRQLVRTFKDLPSHPAVYLCIPVPASGDNKFNTKPTVLGEEIIPVLRKVAREEGVGVIDLWHTGLFGKTGDAGKNEPVGTPASEFFQDGIHPTKSGNAVIAAKMAEILKAPPVEIEKGPGTAQGKFNLSVSAQGRKDFQWFRDGKPMSQAERGEEPNPRDVAPGKYRVTLSDRPGTWDRIGGEIVVGE